MQNLSKNETISQLGRVAKKYFSFKHSNEEYNLGRTQWKILDTIIRNPGTSQESLAMELQLDKTSIAKAVKKLEIHQMLRKQRSLQDARKYELFPEEKAINIRESMNRQLDIRSSLALEGLSDMDIKNLLRILSKIENNIEKNRRNIKTDNGEKFSNNDRSEVKVERSFQPCVCASNAKIYAQNNLEGSKH